MKNIKLYEEKYKDNPDYESLGNGIYKLDSTLDGVFYVTTLSFEQEPELEEGEDACDISQYPLEDILDCFNCFISDFYDDLNVVESNTCYQEFASDYKEDIEKLLTIVGQHVYNKEENGTIRLMLNDEVLY